MWGVIISKYWSSHWDYRSNWPPSPAHPPAPRIIFSTFQLFYQNSLQPCPVLPVRDRTVKWKQWMVSAMVCRVGVMLRGVRVSGSAFISSMKILVIVFVLSHSCPARPHHGNREIQICPNNVYRLDNMLSWLPSLILCHGESVSQDITEDYLSTCRSPPPRCPSVFIFPSLSPSLPVTDSRAVSQKILMTWPELSQLPQ